MNLQQAEKTKSLISSSPILSPQERTEWLALLELMDDKQLGELEKILQSGVTSQESGVRNGAAAPKISSPNPQILNISPKSDPVQPQMPRLSHIVNLPKNFEQAVGGKVRPFFPLKQNSGPAVVAGAPVKESKTPKFLDKLKLMLSEKELPAGKQQAPLELKDGGGHASSMKHEALEQGPVLLPMLKPLPPPAQEAKNPPTVFDRPVFPKPLGSTAAKIVPKPSAPAFSAGINFPQTSEKQKNGLLASIKGSLGAKKGGPQLPEATQVVAEQASFDTLEGVASLNLKTFKNADIDAFSKKIKDLVSNSGYFEVIFNLEKSPIFKNYVATGLKALSGTEDFDALSLSAPGQYLNRQEFEKFTDLLAKIQTG